MVGKWHLGHADTKYWPQNRGFDHFYGNTVGEVDYFTMSAPASSIGSVTASSSRRTATTATLIGDEAVKIIEEQDTAKPFFLYFASLAPHAPYQAIKSDEDRYVFDDQGCDAAHLRGNDHVAGRTVEPDR